MSKIDSPIQTGTRLTYNDGRIGHSGIQATVIAVDSRGFVCQFDDRADTTRIQFTDRDWMNHLAIS